MWMLPLQDDKSMYIIQLRLLSYDLPSFYIDCTIMIFINLNCCKIRII